MNRGRAALVRTQLRDVARQRGEDFSLTLNSYAVERYLYRLSKSAWADKFILKGALLFAVWFDEPHRPTRDADFLAFGPDDAATVKSIVTEICAIEADDGIVFDPASIRLEEIRENVRYGGQRVRFSGSLDGSLCTAQIDLGFGDAVTPEPKVVTYPSLLSDMPAPVLRAYPRETVISEKLEAIVSLGMSNSRMKDFFDLRTLVREGRADRVHLVEAIRATFDRRGTPIPEGVPLGLSSEFANSAAKIALWKGFLDRNRLQAPALFNVVTEVRAALEEPMQLAGDRSGPPRPDSPNSGGWNP